MTDNDILTEYTAAETVRERILQAYRKRLATMDLADLLAEVGDTQETLVEAAVEDMTAGLEELDVPDLLDVLQQETRLATPRGG